MRQARPGPKAAADTTPVPTTRFPRQDRAKFIARFAKTYVVVPKGKGQGKPFVFRKYQREMIAGCYAPGIRTALWSEPRGQGKSTKAAVLSVVELFTVPSAQVIVVASDQRQANIILNTVKRMIEESPELAKRARILKESIEVPGMGSEMVSLPADVGALQGWDPSLCLVDELHQVNHDVWEAIIGFSGKRERSLTLAISTPSDRSDSIMQTLVNLGRENTDPSFYFKEFTSDPAHPVDCMHCWKQANPALGDFLSEDGMRSLLNTMREPAFRRYRLGQFVTPSTAWMTPEQWKACEDTNRVVRADEQIVLFGDGSISGDSTAIIGCTISEPHHLFLVGIWERPKNADSEWRVSRLDVDREQDAAVKAHRTVEVAWDPWGWRDQIAAWSRRYGQRRVIEYPTNARGRMGPATDKLTEAILEGNVTHDGSPELTAHVLNAVVTESKYGVIVHKDSQKSERKIDAAVAAIGAYDRATFHASKTKPKRNLRVVKASW